MCLDQINTHLNLKLHFIEIFKRNTYLHLYANGSVPIIRIAQHEDIYIHLHVNVFIQHVLHPTIVIK